MRDLKLLAAVRRLALLAAAVLFVGACAEGGAFGVRRVDGTFVLSTSSPVLLRVWSQGAINVEQSVTSDTIVFLSESTGEVRTRYVTRRNADSTVHIDVRSFTYARRGNTIEARFAWQCSRACTPVGPAPAFFYVLDGVLHRQLGERIAPYRQIE